MTYIPEQTTYRPGHLPLGTSKIAAARDPNGAWWISLEEYLEANAINLAGKPLKRILASYPTVFLTRDDKQMLFIGADRLGVFLGHRLSSACKLDVDEAELDRKREVERIIEAFRARHPAPAAPALAEPGSWKAILPAVEELKAELERQGHRLEITVSADPANVTAVFYPAGLSAHDLLNVYTIPKVEFQLCYSRNGELAVSVTARGLSSPTARKSTTKQEYAVTKLTKQFARSLALRPIEVALADLKERAVNASGGKR